MQREDHRSLWRTMRIVLCLVAMATACSRAPDETRIREAIQAMQSAAEARKAAGVLEYIAEDFTGNNGEADREGLARILKFQFLRNTAFGADVHGLSIAVDEGRATAKFDLALSDSSGRWLPSGGETFAVVTGWRREGSRWICYSATWNPKDKD